MAGDVWLVHLFLVHRAQRHRGTRHHSLAQPPLEPIEQSGLASFVINSTRRPRWERSDIVLRPAQQG